MDDSNRDTIENLSKKDISWENFLRLASHHKLLPLAYRHLSAICPENVPGVSLLRLQQFYNNNLLENFIKSQELVRIIDIFEKNDIVAVAFKGPVLTQGFYGDIGLRSFYDLDILVDRKKFQNALLLLKSLGFQNYPKGISDKYLVKFAALSHHASMVNDAGVQVELHWDVAGYYRGLRLGYKNFISTIIETEFIGHKLKTFNEEMLLIYLALHGQRHSWNRYDYICCFAEVLRKMKNLNLDLLENFADSYNLKKVLLFAISLADKMLEVKVYTEYINQESLLYTEATDFYVRKCQLLNELVVNKITNDKNIVIPRHLGIDGDKYSVGAFKDRVRRYCFPMIEDYEKLPLPYSMRHLYYLIRPIRQLSKKLLL